MNRHLSPEEFSKTILGEQDDKVDLHARSCSACQTELDLFWAAISLFSKSARQWAQREPSSDKQTLQLINEAPLNAMWKAISWSTVAIIVAILVSFSARPNRKPDAALQPSEADDGLLQQVDSEVSRTIPAPLEPLTLLMSSDPMRGNLKSNRAKHRSQITGRKSVA